MLVVTPAFCCGLTLLTYLVFPPPHTNLLILGVDGHESEGFASRTDSIMLLGINPGTLYVSIFSLPRDLFVEAPDYGFQRINVINLLGEQQQAGSGPRLVNEAIRSTFGITIERYVRLDFQGFVRLIDAVGGVTIDVERTIVDDLYPDEQAGGVMTVRFDSGVQHMDGERALIYSRTRQADDDYRRAARQQQVLSALFGRLVNPAHWPAALRVINESIDTDLTLWDMLMLAPPVLLNAGHYDQLVLNREYILGTAEGHAVPNIELLAPWLEARFKG
jgi:LCP family protein required for cell wall assembly